MRVVIQRVKEGRVAAGGEVIGEIGAGLVILLGIGERDRAEEARWLAHKCATLRIFEDDEGKFNRSIQDIGGEALVVSQFTLYADSEKGRRPSFTKAAGPQVAEPLVNRFVEFLQEEGVPTRAGKFGAHMLVEIENDGPVTIVLEREPKGDR
jgi:D-tyrosyl-tRNA(Tyr) deacylase